MPWVPGPQEQYQSTSAKSSPSTQDADLAPQSDHQEASPPFSARTSPPEPFPELDDDLDSELADLSPAFAHEINSQTALHFLPLPEPAKDGVSSAKAKATSQAGALEDCPDSGEMKEATRRGLEWARIMFGQGMKDCEAKDDECEDREDENK